MASWYGCAARSRKSPGACPPSASANPTGTHCSMATASRRPAASCRRRKHGADAALRILYLLALYLAVPVVSTMLLWRGLRDRSYWRNFNQRFGFGARLVPQGVWLHAVSVGEVQACAPLVSALSRRHPGLPLTVTTFTPTGSARAR